MYYTPPAPKNHKNIFSPYPPLALYLMQTTSVVTINAESEVKDFWVMEGDVTVVYEREQLREELQVLPKLKTKFQP